MTVFQAIIFGIAQGLGEFLPISSSAHLVLIPWLFHWRDPGLTFDVALHAGTLLAVASFFWKDWLSIISHGLRQGLKTPKGKLFWLMVIASIPGALTGLLLEQKAETIFRNPLMIGLMLIIMGFIIYIADDHGRKNQPVESISLMQSIIIGISQALAIIPGVSRSGITIAAGLFLGLTREEAARFSFLLSTPIIVGAGLYKFRHLTVGMITPPFVIGVVTSAVVGFLVIGFLLRWLQKRGFMPFVWYRWLLGLIVIAVVFIRR